MRKTYENSMRQSMNSDLKKYVDVYRDPLRKSSQGRSNYKNLLVSP